MRRAIAALAALAALSVAACASAPVVEDQVNISTQGMVGALEPIHAAAFTRDLAVFWVGSNGCTEKADLTPVVSRVGDGSTITLRRIDDDECKAPVDDGVEVIWSFEELGLEPGSAVSVNNPYQLPKG